MRFAVRGLMLFVLAIWLVGAAAAQDVQRIAAIVNDDVISGYDIEQRIQLVLASTQLQDTPDNRRRLRGQVLRSLIDEYLQIQEAERFGIKVTQEDYDRAYRFIERQNKVPAGQIDSFLTRAGIPKAAVQQQLKAEMAWSKLIHRRLSPNIQIGEEEVNEVLNRLHQNAGKPEYRISEIFLPIDNPEQDDEVRQSALRLLQQIHDGASFAAMARQFSRGPSAADGGAVGWIQPGQLTRELEQTLAAMTVDSISQPVRSSGGYYLLELHERRTIATADPMATTLKLKQLIVPVDNEATGEAKAAQEQLAADISSNVSGCDGIEAKAKELKLTRYGDLGTVKLGDMPPDIQTAVHDLETGKFSKPINIPDGLLLLMVCDRQEPKSDLPQREDIVRTLQERRLAMLAQRYMRDLRRDAVVELR